MVITLPTGFYASAIKDVPGVAGNITFTVSNSPPPRTRLLFVKVPVGLSRRRQLPRVYTDGERRAAVAKMAFSVTAGRGVSPAYGAKQYEPGQIIEFDDQDMPTVEPMLVTTVTEVRHDTNLLDLSAIGIDAETQSIIDAEAAAAYRDLQSQLSAATTARQDYEAELNAAQKSINEVNKAIDGVVSVLEMSQSAALEAALVSLRSKMTDLITRRDELVVLANDAADDAALIRIKITKVAQLVR